MSLRLIVAAVLIAKTAALVACSPGPASSASARDDSSELRRDKSERPEASTPSLVPTKASISYDDAKPILERLRDTLPPELKTKTTVELKEAWPDWVSRHDAEIRARLERGDEDSIVNFWLYGTTFTDVPRATQQDLAKLSGRASGEQILLARLDDLVAGLATPGANERLQFARQVVERHGIDPRTSVGREHARQYLVDARERVIAENDGYRLAAQSANRLTDPAAKLGAYATLYRDRGLSSDTSLPADFAVEKALEAINSKGKLDAGSVRRVAILGPGLDFTDKAQGYDFYPQQTVQPFAVLDSLVRLGLATRDTLSMMTFDVSPRVNQHLEAARRRAQDGASYVVQLPLTRDDRLRQWNPDLVAYWQRLGDRIGHEVEALPPPPGAGGVRVRAVGVDPAVVLSIVPQDLNIILERFVPPRKNEARFDLIVATNIFVYYDAFDQALALANVSKMLRPGGFLLTNYAVFPTAPMETSASLMTTVDFDRQHNGDTLFWYQRR